MSSTVAVKSTPLRRKLGSTRVNNSTAFGDLFSKSTEIKTWSLQCQPCAAATTNLTPENFSNQQEFGFVGDPTSAQSLVLADKLSYPESNMSSGR
jgi:hypothetical protein